MLYEPESLRSLATFAALYVALPGLACAAVLLGAPRAAWRALKGQRTILVAFAAWAAFALVVCVQYARTALFMNYSHRFYAPLFPLALLAFGVLLDRGLRALGSSRRDRILAAVAAVLLLAQLGVYARRLRSEVAYAETTKRLLADEHIPAGLFLRERVPPSEWLVVVVDAGAIPYYSRLKTVDFGGLNDEYLSKRFSALLTPEQLADYFFARNPGAAVFTSRDWEKVDGPEPSPITTDPRFAQYVLARRYRSDALPNYYELVYLRKDLVDAAE
jgi:hypothetical protein